MSSIIRFGTDGWRARLDGDFNEENVVRVADAAARVWAAGTPGATVYLGFDSRLHAAEFALLAAQVISARGLSAVLSDRPLPTPALSWAVLRDAGAAGGLMVTGSRHTADYLGMKFRVSDGGGGTEDFVDALQDAIDPDPVEERGAVSVRDLVSSYRENLTSLVDADLISRAGLRVVCDPMYGASAGVLAESLRDLGVEVREIHAELEEGWEDLRPEPVEPWVDECEREVVAIEAQAGFVLDGDADRVGAVDERGRFVSAQKIIALVLGHLVVDRGLAGRVVLNLSTSMLCRRTARALGCRLTIRPIGFRHIYEEMLKGDVLLGGEEAGGIGVPSHLPERDGLLVSLLLCELMAETGKPLGVLVDELGQAMGVTSYGRRDIRLAPEDIESLRTILPGLNPPTIAGKAPVAVSHMDGLRLEFDDESWLLLRPGGTEPVARVYAEAATVEERDELLEEGARLARAGL